MNVHEDTRRQKLGRVQTVECQSSEKVTFIQGYLFE